MHADSTDGDFMLENVSRFLKNSLAYRIPTDDNWSDPHRVY
jgi:hypothetical protein